jgi:hypothetical protein
MVRCEVTPLLLSSAKHHMAAFVENPVLIGHLSSDSVCYLLPSVPPMPESDSFFHVGWDV